jgi:hypothetical protein
VKCSVCNCIRLSVHDVLVTHDVLVDGQIHTMCLDCAYDKLRATNDEKMARVERLIRLIRERDEQ